MEGVDIRCKMRVRVPMLIGHRGADSDSHRDDEDGPGKLLDHDFPGCAKAPKSGALEAAL
jgi:hypothetical protein